MKQADLAFNDPSSHRAVSHSRWLDRVFLSGLAGVFLVNAIVAFVQPDDFTRLVARSTLGEWVHLAGSSWIGPLIAINDLLLGVAVIAAIRFTRTRALVLAWTGAWLFAVTAIKLTAL